MQIVPKGEKMHEGENKIVKGETKDYGGEQKAQELRRKCKD